ncbi:type I pullulanase [Paenibacillus sp. alder61]|uniref:Type I pullulanase n=1 Tax=Paenibacillus faecis TaxID=862114 RepID=A0A5D0CQV5_9BACL|nr:MULTISPECIES: type I pullulanase [Paenibacillus]MCA1292414.1 type I pullulanase [Paenibacillus sp. alder61]TYA11485.1 type I pullulanase [Paenibacillus faecis]
MSVQKEIDIAIDYGDPEVTGGVSVFDPAFDEKYNYDGDDLGAAYTPEMTVFRLWAPTASEALVVLYASWNSEPEQEVKMTRGRKGTWVAEKPGDLHGVYYTFKVRIGSDVNEAVDPYAKAVGVNGDRGVVVDLRRTDPEHWTAAKPAFTSPVDAVIYEVHIRDLSIHPESGIRHKGLYLGLAEAGTKGPDGIPTGLDHIAGLGVTHVQLLPVFDYSTESVDETRLDQPHYNWGYDPKNYNAPEGSYATDPYSPTARITELKQCIQALHDKGLRVIMDVVYNHVYDGYLVNFTKLVPGYYLRYKPDGKFSNGSFCGNECASERPMMRKFIIDSLLHWIREYRIDGFRFDLMGLLDVDTMKEIRRRMDEIDPSILLIGEGWNMEGSVLPNERRAHQGNAWRFPGVGHFNDGIRDAVKGSNFEEKSRGFVSQGSGLEDGIKRGIVGGIRYGEGIEQFAREPVQSVNYVECHDNHTLWDKLALSAEGASAEQRRHMHRLASAIVLTSQGIPFIHAGQEFMRTKNGVENSYKSPVEINRLDWARCAERQNDVLYVASLIRLRKSHPAFRLRTAEEIRKHLRFEPAPPLAVAYTLRDHAGGDPDRHLYVLYNANPEPVTLELPDLGAWEVHYGGEFVQGLAQRSLNVRGVGMVVLHVTD